METQLTSNHQLFAEIFKIDKKQKMVYGYASTGARDSQGEIILPEAMKNAMPSYMKFGNIREMHGKTAAGVVKEHNFTDTGTYIGAKIVDASAWEKCVEGVYKGFSIGGRITERDSDDETVIKGIELTEISLVDRPANPEALFDIVKANTPETTVEEVAEDETNDEETVEKVDAKGDAGGAKAKAVDKPATETTEVVEDKAAPVYSTPNPTGSMGGTSVASPSAKVDDEALDYISVIRNIFKFHKVNDLAKLDDGSMTDAVAMTLDYLAQIEKGSGMSVQRMHDLTVKLGAECDEPDGDEDDAGKLLSKVYRPGDIAKLKTEVETLTKTIAERDEAIGTLNKEIEELKARPAAKTPALKVVSKGEDFSIDVVTDEEDDLSKMDDMTKVLHAIKKAQKQPLGRI